MGRSCDRAAVVSGWHHGEQCSPAGSCWKRAWIMFGAPSQTRALLGIAARQKNNAHSICLTGEVALRRGATRVAGLRLQPGRSRDALCFSSQTAAGAEGTELWEFRDCFWQAPRRTMFARAFGPPRGGPAWAYPLEISACSAANQAVNARERRQPTRSTPSLLRTPPGEQCSPGA